ncbi:MAG: TraB/GumN family protein [Candidatus Aenigmarchaeota archaeon]|nr:TraB/GumN family protein [Candidatus Aenigmarchaeota archaeon]
MKKIILVPTSHVAKQSLKKVKEVIEKEKPDCVAVELDMNRYSAMKEQEKTSSLEALKTLGFMTFLLYWVLKKLQSWLGKKLGILPGSEMIQAVDVARKAGIKVALIDRDMRITFLRVKSISWKEKMKLLLFLFKGLTIDYLLLKIRKDGKAIDLDKVPPKELIEQAMEMMKKEFPQLYRVLVKERDEFMASRLKDMSSKFEKIVAVTGAGHTNGLQKLLG